MASVVQIVNRGLDKLGEAHIASLTANVKAARVMNGLYEPVRDALLRSHPWNFATKRVALAASVDVPAFGFTAQYPVPADNLRILNVFSDEAGRNAIAYALEADDDDNPVISCDTESIIYVRYIKAVTDSEKFDSLFTELLSLHLALAAEKSIADMTDGARDQIKQDIKALRAQAYFSDGQEGSPDDLEDESWIGVRW